MKMKWIKTLTFTKRNICKETIDKEVIYLTAKNETLALRALKMAELCDCRISNLKMTETICEINIWATHDRFLAFVNNFIEEFDNYIENINF